MTRRLASFCLIALVVPALAYGYQKPPRTTRRGETASAQNDLNTARSAYYAAQASLYSALADSQALVKILDLSDVPDLDLDLARTLISTINRSIQGTTNGTVRMGQAVHSVEKQDSLKPLRFELDKAIQAADDAHSAADGHGPIGPHALNVQAHLLNAIIALNELAQSVDVQPLRPPSSKALDVSQAQESPRSDSR